MRAPNGTKFFIVFCNFLFIFKIVKRHRAFRIWRSKNLYIIYYIIIKFVNLRHVSSSAKQRQKVGGSVGESMNSDQSY